MESWVLSDAGSGSKVWEVLDRAISESRKNPRPDNRAGSFDPRHLSTTERISAISGPA
jgi:hypothetical protein